jgi:Zn-dependent peptidase ImmA (M78 family)
VSAGVLSELRKLRPNRRLSLDESLRIAEQQANRLLRIYELNDVSDAPVPEELISDLPRFLVRRYPLGTTVSGLAHWDSGRWCIALNSREPLVRQRFSLAHELGHIVESPFDRYARPELVERIADHFAANLLMPKSWVKQLWAQRVQQPSDLAERFHVSEVAMTRRLNELRLDEADDLGRAFGRHGRRYLRLSRPVIGSMS